VVNIFPNDTIPIYWQDNGFIGQPFQIEVQVLYRQGSVAHTVVDTIHCEETGVASPFLFTMSGEYSRQGFKAALIGQPGEYSIRFRLIQEEPGLGEITLGNQYSNSITGNFRTVGFEKTGLLCPASAVTLKATTNTSPLGGNKGSLRPYYHFSWKDINDSILSIDSTCAISAPGYYRCFVYAFVDSLAYPSHANCVAEYVYHGEFDSIVGIHISPDLFGANHTYQNSVLQTCAQTPFSLSSNHGGWQNQYAWYKDGNLLAETTGVLNDTANGQHDYKLRVNRNGCVGESNVSVVNGYQLNALVDTAWRLPGNVVKTKAVPVNGTAPFSYAWNQSHNCSNTACSEVTLLSPDSVNQVSITDNLGCVVLKSPMILEVFPVLKYFASIANDSILIPTSLHVQGRIAANYFDSTKIYPTSSICTSFDTITNAISNAAKLLARKQLETGSFLPSLGRDSQTNQIQRLYPGLYKLNNFIFSDSLVLLGDSTSEYYFLDNNNEGIIIESDAKLFQGIVANSRIFFLTNGTIQIKDSSQARAVFIAQSKITIGKSTGNFSSIFSLQSSIEFVDLQHAISLVQPTGVLRPQFTPNKPECEGEWVDNRFNLICNGNLDRTQLRPSGFLPPNTDPASPFYDAPYQVASNPRENHTIYSTYRNIMLAEYWYPAGTNVVGWGGILEGRNNDTHAIGNYYNDCNVQNQTNEPINVKRDRNRSLANPFVVGEPLLNQGFFRLEDDWYNYRQGDYFKTRKPYNNIDERQSSIGLDVLYSWNIGFSKQYIFQFLKNSLVADRRYKFKMNVRPEPRNFYKAKNIGAVFVQKIDNVGQLSVSLQRYMQPGANTYGTYLIPQTLTSKVLNSTFIEAAPSPENAFNVEGEFTATGNENAVVIGHFEPTEDGETPILTTNNTEDIVLQVPSGHLHDEAYHYFDRFTLEMIPDEEQIFTCENTFVIYPNVGFGCPQPDVEFHWKVDSDLGTVFIGNDRSCSPEITVTGGHAKVILYVFNSGILVQNVRYTIAPGQIQVNAHQGVFSCGQQESMRLDVNVISGEAPYSVRISRGGNILVNNQIFSGPTYFYSTLVSGVYDIVVTDNRQCTSTRQVELVDGGFQVSIARTPDGNCFPENATPIFSLEVEPVNFTGQINYVWYNTSGAEIGSGNTLSGIAENVNYQVLATADNGCIAESTYILELGEIPEVTIEPLDCINGNTARLRINITGGLPPYIIRVYSVATNGDETLVNTLNTSVNFTEFTNPQGTLRFEVEESEFGCTSNTMFVVPSTFTAQITRNPPGDCLPNGTAIQLNGTTIPNYQNVNFNWVDLNRTPPESVGTGPVLINNLVQGHDYRLMASVGSCSATSLDFTFNPTFSPDVNINLDPDICTPTTSNTYTFTANVNLDPRAGVGQQTPGFFWSHSVFPTLESTTNPWFSPLESQQTPGIVTVRVIAGACTTVRRLNLNPQLGPGTSNLNPLIITGNQLDAECQTTLVELNTSCADNYIPGVASRESKIRLPFNGQALNVAFCSNNEFVAENVQDVLAGINLYLGRPTGAPGVVLYNLVPASAILGNCAINPAYRRYRFLPSEVNIDWPNTGDYFLAVEGDPNLQPNEGWFRATLSRGQLNNNGNLTVTSGCRSAIEFIKEQTTTNLELFPNPTTGRLTIRGLAKEGRFKVIGADGRAVLLGSISPDQPELDGTALPPGLYFLEVPTLQGTQKLKFAKQ